MHSHDLLEAHDLDAAFRAARLHLRAHPDDAQLLGQLACVTPTDPNASTKFRRFVGDVIADAIAEERHERERRGLARPAPRPVPVRGGHHRTT